MAGRLDQDGLVDLHVHSSVSDGLNSPEELVVIARDRGLRAIALTDHDVTAGVKRAMVAAQSSGIEVVAGVELSCAVGKYKDLHIVGLGIDPEERLLIKELESLRRSRETRMDRILAQLNERLLREGKRPVSRGDLPSSPGRSLGRPQLAQALVSIGHAANRDDAFGRYLEQVDTTKQYLAAELAVQLIHQAGGVAILAHPIAFLRFCFPDLRLKRDLDLASPLRTLLDECRGLGIQGLEAYHPHNSLEGQSLLRDLAEAYGMVVSGGSDYHGEEPWHRLYPEIDSRSIPYKVLADMKAHCRI